MSKIIITGADGYIGRNLINEISKRFEDDVIYAIVQKDTGILKNCDNLKIIECDMKDILSLTNYDLKDADILYHFAWEGVQPEVRKDIEVQMRNIDYSINCLKLAKELGVKKIIFPGSTLEYAYDNDRINSKAKPSPTCAYSSVKASIRYLAEEYARENDIDFTYVVLASIYSHDRRDNNVVFYTINSLLNKNKPSLTKLEQIWNYVHISDVIEGLILVWKKGKAGSFYAIGSDQNIALSEYINIIYKLIDNGTSLGIGEVPYNNENIPRTYIDLTEIQKDTGYVPKVKFADGIFKAIEQIKKEVLINE